MSTQIWVDETRDMLLSGYVEDLDILTGEVLVGASQIIVQGYASSIVKGVVVEINAELMYVVQVVSTTISVLRGYGGSTPAAHAASDIVRVSPSSPLTVLSHQLTMILQIFRHRLMACSKCSLRLSPITVE